MKSIFTGIALAALLTVGASLPCRAEDAAKPADTAAPAASKAEAPASVPRPSIAPKTAEPKSAEPTAAPVTTDAAPRRHRRYARHHYRRYGYWEPFPLYLPHFHHHHISWARIRWFF